MEKLAIHGGSPACDPPADPVKLRPLRFGEAEKEALARVVDSGALCRTFGTEAGEFESEAAKYFGTREAVACSSGTASIHAALAAAGVGWGDEVVTSPITDMGSIIAITAQGARPVFADVSPRTFNMTPETVAGALTERTRAILMVHLAGLCCDMEEIMRLAGERGVMVVEDCAQSWLAGQDGRTAGTFGQIGCFSINGYKHISCGDGGVAITGDRELARRMRLFVDKAYDRRLGVRNPEVFAMNYRMTELQAAVARVQLGKLEDIVRRRKDFAEALAAGIADVPGIILPLEPPGCSHSWWYFVIRADRDVTGAPADELAQALEAEGVPAWTGYCGGMPVYMYDCFRKPEKSFFRRPPLAPDGRDRPIGEYYPPGLCPVAEMLAREMIIISVSEFFSRREADAVAGGIDKVFRHFAS